VPQALPDREADLDERRIAQLLGRLWADDADDKAQRLIDLTCEGLDWLTQRFRVSTRTP
jgi:hypothetical protein